MYKIRTKKGLSLIEDLANYTVVDIETTGLDWNFNKILEISALKVRNKKIIGKFSKIINPHEPLPYFIKNLTGITDDMTKDAKELESVLKEFKEFLKDDVIVGHNVHFDINFLYDNFEEVLEEPLSNNFIDTLRIARKLLPDLPHHKLDDLIAYYGLEVRDKHRALNDCILTNQVYLCMCNMVYTQYGNWNCFREKFK